MQYLEVLCFWNHSPVNVPLVLCDSMNTEVTVDVQALVLIGL